MLRAKNESCEISCSSFLGGAERDRTADPLLAKQVLSQLSYSPNLYASLARKVGRIGRTAYARQKSNQYVFPPDRISNTLSTRPPTDIPRSLMVGLGRIELPTSRLSGVRSNHLSYRPFGLFLIQLNDVLKVAALD